MTLMHPLVVMLLLAGCVTSLPKTRVVTNGNVTEVYVSPAAAKTICRESFKASPYAVACTGHFRGDHGWSHIMILPNDTASSYVAHEYEHIADREAGRLDLRDEYAEKQKVQQFIDWNPR